MKETKRPVTVNELSEGIHNPVWMSNKVYKIVYKAYKMKLLGRMLVENNKNKHCRRVYCYYPTKQYQHFINSNVKRKLNTEQLKDLPDELKDILK